MMMNYILELCYVALANNADLHTYENEVYITCLPIRYNHFM